MSKIVKVFFKIQVGSQKILQIVEKMNFHKKITYYKLFKID